MGKIIIAFVAENLNKVHSGKISFSRFVELLNEEAEMNQSPDSKITTEILTEFHKAKTKHPTWPTCLFRMDAIVGEEKGEVTRAVVQYDMEGGKLEEIRKELIQTAAMCIRMIENLPEG